MKFFLREIKYYSIGMFYSLDGMFWTLLYPILMAGLFFTIFSAVGNSDTGKIEIGIEKDNPVYIYRTFLTRRIGTMETGRRQVKNCLG